MTGYLARARRSHLFWQILFGLVVLVGTSYLISQLKEILIPVVIALLLAYLLDPAIDWLEERGVGRSLAILILLLGIMFFIAAILLLLVPLLGSEVTSFANRIPLFVSRVKTQAVPWLEQTFHMTVPRTATELADTLGYSIQELARQAVKPLGGLAGKAVEGAYFIVVVLGTLLLIPFLTFFFLRDFDKMAATVRALIPRRHRPWADQTWKDIDKTLSGWIRGQLLVMLVLGTLYSIGYSIVGIPLALLVGMLTGLMAFIPYLGAATGFLIALILAFLDWQGWGQVAGVVGAFGTVQFLDALFVTPNILGHETGMSPATVVLALLVFGKLFGFVGVLLAVPVAGVIHVLLTRVAEAYLQSAFYLADSPDGFKMTTLTKLDPPNTESRHPAP